MTHVLITGANRGIGFSLAQEARARGMVVTGTTRGARPENADIDWQDLDVRSSASLQSLGARFANRPLSLLVCNAGVFPDEGPLADDPDTWQHGFAVNVTGVFMTIQALLPALVAGQGKIAIIASIMGSSTRAPGGSLIYRATKAAVINLARNLATDLRPKGIAVGAYHPGWVKTDMGGPGADIDPETSAKGLMTRFGALDLATTGVWEDWQGVALKF